ncbi:MAG TPA: proton-conducting transporter membrane subunit [Chitinivibrionales bacterium]|nr:proton-conducting transporter membrane subunit [Chitinivibrionales bacterium]
MSTLLFLLIFPAAVSLLFAILPPNSFRNSLVRISCLLIAAGSVYAAIMFSGKPTFFKAELPHLEMMFFAGEMALSLFLLYKCIGIKQHEWYIPVLIIIQAGIMAYCELTHSVPEVDHALYIDNFSIIMALIIGIIGSLICLYAISYMRDYHHHHPEMKNRQRSFFFILFFFLSAMFGVVFSNNLVWLYFFWEITTLSSFILIGYPKTEEATRNAYRALGLNLLGGLGFAGGILYLVKFCPAHTVELSRVIELGPAVMLIPVVCISFAGLAKSAQMPFSSWLLGAMVAPTPVSALLHSSTMVKAGIFIIIKFAPVLQNTWAGYFLALVGGVTFLMTSIIAVTQSNAKRVLAYSTIANLGLIVACAGVGTYETLWAAVLLTIFHAVSKGLLFLGVGSIEHKIGSRDIEDMGGLIVNRPGLAMVMLIGILGMFLAPFGMLISKWACLEAFVNSNIVLAVLLAFGSAPTLFFWTKWMGKIVSVPAGAHKGEGAVAKDEWTALGLLAAGTVATAALFPLMSFVSVEPYVFSIYHHEVSLTQGNIIIMSILLGLMVLLPLSFLAHRAKPVYVPRYLAGANVGDSGSFVGAMQVTREAATSNYYLGELFSEKKLCVTSIAITIVLIITMFGAVKL